MQLDRFPFKTYKDYIEALAANDAAYQALSQFLTTSPDLDYGLRIHRETQVPREGSVSIIDQTSARFEIREYLIGSPDGGRDASKCISALKVRSETSKLRIILLSYNRDSKTGVYTGINTDVLDAIGTMYRVHPEVMMWHFGSDFGLDPRFFLYTGPPLQSALSNNGFCQLRSQNSIVSCCLHPSFGAKTETGKLLQNVLALKSRSDAVGSDHFCKES